MNWFKKKTSEKNARQGEYDKVFLKRKELRTRQPVYISRTVHQRINKLVHIIALAGKDISVGGYIDNIVEEHLERHETEIVAMCRNITNP